MMRTLLNNSISRFGKYAALIVFIIATLAFGHSFKAQGAANDMTGWAWSSNIGWVSFNSSNVGAGGGNYKVILTTPSGDISGTAWSSNIGWMSFDRAVTGNPPSDDIGSGSGALARVNIATGQVTGWARFLAGCSGSGWNEAQQRCVGTGAGNANGVNSQAGNTPTGWDGWVKLSGTNHTSPTANGNGGVTYNNVKGSFTGYAWGNEVVGWLNFSPSISSGDPLCNPTREVCSGGGTSNNLTATCSIGQSQVAVPGSITWSAIATGGITPYSYEWARTGTYVSGAITTTYERTTAGTEQPGLRVTDGNGTVATATCPVGQYVDPETLQNITISVTSEYGADQRGKTTSNYARVKKGLPFTIRLRSDNDMEYTRCSYVTEKTSSTWVGSKTYDPDNYPAANSGGAGQILLEEKADVIQDIPLVRYTATCYYGDEGLSDKDEVIVRIVDINSTEI